MGSRVELAHRGIEVLELRVLIDPDRLGRLAAATQAAFLVLNFLLYAPSLGNRQVPS